jgi:hypothetical protein
MDRRIVYDPAQRSNSGSSLSNILGNIMDEESGSGNSSFIGRIRNLSNNLQRDVLSRISELKK